MSTLRGKIPTQWEPSPGMNKYGMYDSDKKHLAGQRVTGIIEEDDHDVEISSPHLWWEAWITTAGNVVNVPMTCNRLPQGMSRPDREELSQRRERCQRAGWIHYETGFPAFAPAANSPFEAPVPGPGWLEKRDATIAALKAKHKSRSAAFDDQWKADRAAVMKDLGMTLQDFAASLKDAMSSLGIKVKGKAASE